ncbi:MAG TPA: ligase-associated DNA damage response DEXH box helicase [Hyphomicrobiales bacterium]|nr:ligase-associated DNA damage response DEXH box helicase [Hyphomicrobiales bacterium]
MAPTAIKRKRAGAKTVAVPLPPTIAAWFAARGWQPRPHQTALLAHAAAGRSTLLVAPTGAGKTLAGFLPTLVEFAGGQDEPSLRGAKRRGNSEAASALLVAPGLLRSARNDGRGGLHTLYISPLKALAVDVARNVEAPAAEMGVPIRIETRTGDTPPSKRMRQRFDPPDVLLTTPEQVALLLSNPDAPRLFGRLRRIVIDELHAVAPTKRGDLLALDLARLGRLAPGAVRVGLSATVADPEALCRWLVRQTPPGTAADLLVVEGGAVPEITIHETAENLPWAGHAARHALPAIYQEIRAHKTTLVFVNTRALAELAFQELWRLNDDNLAIALHHGSLDVAQRRRVEAAMAAGRLRAVVCTATLDLGIDWGDVDLVVHLGGPKGSSRLIQRIGRANHRLDEPSAAILVPGNRFEVIECEATRAAVLAGEQDTEPLRPGALDVLAQHILGTGCAAPFAADDLYAEVREALPYAALRRADFDDALAFVATGGYALKSYDRFARIRENKDGLWRVANPQTAQQYRMNVGTIVEADMVRVRLGRTRGNGTGAAAGIPLRGGRVLGQIEEYLAETMVPGDTFLFAGEVLRFEAMVENDVVVTRATGAEAPKIPSYMGARLPLTTSVADRVRATVADPARWDRLPAQVREWLEAQRKRSVLPGPDELLVETFPRANKQFMTCYPFEGRQAHQTLGMLLTRRLERARLHPLGFVATDYALTIWGLGDLPRRLAAGSFSLEELFSQDMLGDDLEAWLLESSLMKRTFRNCAVIAGLVERHFPGQKKSGRQVTISSDLIYDVLRRHQPDHVLLRAARADAARGLLDVARVAETLARVRGRIVHRALDRISPLAVPSILEIGREAVFGAAQEAILAEAADDLIAEAMGNGRA